EGSSGDGSRAEWAEVYALASIDQAAGVALKLADIGEQPVGDEDGLGALEVRVAGHHGFACALSEVDEAGTPFAQTGEGGVDGLAHEEAHVGGDLLVAAAASVELEGEVADDPGELKLGEVVDVLGLGGFGYDRWSQCGLGENFVQTVEHGDQFGIGEDACGGDGAGMRLRGGDLLWEETPVEGEAALPLFQGLVEGLAEAA